MISKILKSKFFLVVFQADLQSDVFYWITGFTMSYQVLKKIHQNNGNWLSSPNRVFFERIFRLLPLYVFMIFFLWKFIGLLGGSGPRFH